MTTAAELMRWYGQKVEVIRAGVGTPVRAFLQAVTRQREDEQQYLPTPLGLRREDRFLYLGPPEPELQAGQDQVSWLGQEFVIQTAQPIYVGRQVSHWWAVLVPRDKEET